VNPQLWVRLHDGGLEAIRGSVPGDLELHISIRYLRSRFPGDGTVFFVTLHGCTKFSYQPYDEPEVADLADVEALDLEILGAEAGDPLPILCTTGTLLVKYSSASLHLDTGGEVSLAALEAASESYWRECPREAGLTPNPSVKGTSTSGLRPLVDAPYLER
jgi:hypothetical protein